MGKANFKDDYQGDFVDDYPGTGEPIMISIKISDDRGETWSRSTLDPTVPIEESGLQAGQLVILNSEKYEVIANDWGEIELRPVKPDRKKGKR